MGLIFWQSPLVPSLIAVSVHDPPAVAVLLDPSEEQPASPAAPVSAASENRLIASRLVNWTSLVIARPSSQRIASEPCSLRAECPRSTASRDPADGGGARPAR